MALSLLDGTTASVDFTIGGASLQCQANSMAIEFLREFLQRVTFCSSNWKTKIFSMKEVRGVIAGFLGKGVASAKLGQWHLTDTTVAIVGTFDTGCTVSLTAGIGRDAGSIQAAALSGRTIEFESVDDDVAVAWVVA